jgi:hypothetical protein
MLSAADMRHDTQDLCCWSHPLQEAAQPCDVPAEDACCGSIMRRRPHGLIIQGTCMTYCAPACPIDKLSAHALQMGLELSMHAVKMPTGTLSTPAATVMDIRPIAHLAAKAASFDASFWAARLPRHQHPG